MKLVRTAVLLAAVLAIRSAGSQRAPSPHTITVRELAPPSAITAVPVRSILGDVRELRDGSLLVNDALARRVLLFDSTLCAPVALRDSIAGTASSYGPRPAMLLPYAGDSLLFADLEGQALVVVDPSGTFTRVAAPPNPRDIPFLSRPGSGVDAGGRLVYQGAPPSQTLSATEGRSTRVTADSEPILRGDFDARRVDTIARVRALVPYERLVVTETDGRVHMLRVVNPLQAVDGWAVAADGSIAVVRGHDYHIDWIEANGRRRSTAKMPFDWRRLTGDDKLKLIDSARTATRRQDSAVAAARARVLAGSGAPAGRAPGNASTVETEYVAPEAIPDYYPPIRTGAVRADLDGNVWILPTTTLQSANGELVYDVVNHDGEVFERVRVPAKRSIAGFGRGGVVYLMWRDGAGGWIIERTRVLR